MGQNEKVGGGALLPDKKGENLFLCSQGGIKKVRQTY